VVLKKITSALLSKVLEYSYVERYKIIATPMNSYKFTEFDMNK